MTAAVDRVMIMAEEFLQKYEAGFRVDREEAFQALVRCNFDINDAWGWLRDSCLLRGFRTLLADGQTRGKAEMLQDQDDALLAFLEKYDNDMEKAVAAWRVTSDAAMAFVADGFGFESYPAGPEATDHGAPASGPPSNIALLQQLSGGTGVPLGQTEAQAALDFAGGDVEMAWAWLRQQTDVNRFLEISGWFGGAARGNRDLAEQVLDAFQWDLLAALEGWQEVTGNTTAGASVSENDGADDEEVEAGAFEESEERMEHLNSGARNTHPTSQGRGWWEQGRAASSSHIRHDPLNPNTAPPDTAPLATRQQLANSEQEALAYAAEVAKFVGGQAVCLADFLKAMDLYNSIVCRYLPFCVERRHYELFRLQAVLASGSCGSSLAAASDLCVVDPLQARSMGVGPSQSPRRMEAAVDKADCRL